PGCVIVVTHDRYFLDKVSTGILAFDGKSEPTLVQGDYTHYRRTQTAATEQADAQKAAQRAADRAAAPAKAAVKSGLSTSEKRELAGMEAAIEAAEDKVAGFEAMLGDPDTWADRPRAAGIERDLATARTDVERLYARWEALMARAESQG
ncbi:MAG: ABC transporter ATP-binding protein, partial [Myxococcales bacterium]|nr:ABC transporter ATP-binding protein [Myxococcales bacterium]